MNVRQTVTSEKLFLSPRLGLYPASYRVLIMTVETLYPLKYRDSDGELRCKFDIKSHVYFMYSDVLRLEM